MLWSFKRWLRPILLSDTYGRDSLVAPEALAKDAGNTWLARASRRRMEAEQLRDSALAVAGLLTRQIGGPSVYPPQPASVTIEGTYGKLPWKTSEGADRYRRALYTFSKRTAPFAMSQTFDAPSGEACMARRESGDTALQALTVLNDELFIEAALELGRRTIDACPDGSPHAVIPYLFQRILVRDPSSDELKILAAYYDQQRAELAASPDSLQQLGLGNAETRKVQPAAQSTPDPLVAAATLTARILLNSDEFINRN
jgi:hypothetical protein